MMSSTEAEIDQRRPFITEASLSSSSNGIHEPPRRTGNVVSGGAHIITGVVGAGVLSLAWCFAQLGWIFGPLSIFAFATVTYVSASLLSDCYRFPHPHGPVRNTTIMHAVRLYLGKKREVLCAMVVEISRIGCAIAYIVAAALSAGYTTHEQVSVFITVMSIVAMNSAPFN